MGTSIQVLQAYPLGTLEVEYTVEEHLNGFLVGRKQHRALVIGFTSDPMPSEFKERETQVGISLLTDRSKWLWVAPESVKPVLADFADLTKQLPDGTVPATHLAMEALPAAEWLGEGHGIALRETPEITGRCIYVHLEATNTKYGSFDGHWTALIGDDFEVRMQHRGGPPQHGFINRVQKWLFANQYAVGLTADQYIRKEL